MNKSHCQVLFVDPFHVSLQNTLVRETVVTIVTYKLALNRLFQKNTFNKERILEY